MYVLRKTVKTRNYQVFHLGNSFFYTTWTLWKLQVHSFYICFWENTLPIPKISAQESISMIIFTAQFYLLQSVDKTFLHAFVCNCFSLHTKRYVRFGRTSGNYPQHISHRFQPLLNLTMFMVYKRFYKYFSFNSRMIK